MANPRVKLDYQLFDHQKKGVEFILKNKGVGALYWEIGCGKTLGLLETFRRLREQDQNLKLFVVCPLALIEGAWGEDVKKFTSYKYQNLHKAKKVEQADIYIVNYEGLLTKRISGFLNQLMSPHDQEWMIALDESSKIKNHETKITKALINAKDAFKYRVVMSGTPAPNCELEYWPQIAFLKDNVFHQRFYAFRAEYFAYGRGNQIMSNGFIPPSAAKELYSKGFKLVLHPSKKTVFMDRLKPLCHFVKKRDCLDLPPTVDQNRIVEMTDDQRRIYKEMEREAIAEIQNSDIVAQVALTKIMKLRQITSGFAIDTRGNSVSIPGTNPKLNELNEILEEAGDQQVIIWAVFQWDIERIAKELGDKCCLLYGKTADKQLSIDQFKSGEKQYLIAHPKSAGHGLTFVNCHLQIFYSLDYSWETYEQARGRTDRAGQTESTTYVHILCENTIDEKILHVLKGKKDHFELVRDYLSGRNTYKVTDHKLYAGSVADSVSI